MSNEMKSKNNLIILAVVVILLAAGIFLTKKASGSVISPAEAKSKTEAFIKANLLADGTKFTLSDPKDYNSGLYEIDVTISGSAQPIQSYLTKDGKMFIPSGMDIAKITAETAAKKGGANANTPAAAPTTQAPKSDKPHVELFVMSYCPFGTQIEKGILPVAQALGNKIDFNLKFVNYAMHGDKEVKENIRQYCIDTQQHAKLLPYVDCFVTSDGSETARAACLSKNGVDTAKMDACFAKTDKQYAIMDTFNKGQAAWGGQFPPFPIYQADNTKYNVGGSPTLIINGKEISSGRDQASLAKTICGAFNKQPAECQKQFASAAPSAGFGAGTDNSGGAASGANCNPNPTN